MESQNLVEVCSTYGEMRAQLIRSRLEAEGIPAIFKNDAFGTLGFVVDGLGEFHILVNAKDEQAAREILAQDDAEGESSSDAQSDAPSDG